MTSKKYVCVVDNEVFGKLVIDTTDMTDQKERLTAGFSSDPKIVEVDEESEVDVGWAWDGNSFNPPGE
jgi:hypothetical protein